MSEEWSEPCPTCYGYGYVNCEYCEGNGWVGNHDTCSFCLGTGRKPCPECGGLSKSERVDKVKCPFCGLFVDLYAPKCPNGHVLERL